MTWPLDPTADSEEHSETHRDLYNFMSLKCLASSTDCPKEKKGGQTNRVKNTSTAVLRTQPWVRNLSGTQEPSAAGRSGRGGQCSRWKGFQGGHRAEVTGCLPGKNSLISARGLCVTFCICALFCTQRRRVDCLVRQGTPPHQVQKHSVRLGVPWPRRLLGSIPHKARVSSQDRAGCRPRPCSPSARPCSSGPCSPPLPWGSQPSPQLCCGLCCSLPSTPPVGCQAVPQ